MTETDRAILSAATMTRLQRQHLALDLGISVPRLLQRMLQLADDPAVIAAEPRLTRLVRERREWDRCRRSGAPLAR